MVTGGWASGRFLKIVTRFGKGLHIRFKGFMAIVILAVILPGCGRSSLHPSLFSGTGVFAGIFDPEHVLPARKPWSLYVGNQLQAASGTTNILFGERLRQRVSRVVGTSSLSSCENVHCALDRGKLIGARYLLTASLRRETEKKITLTFGYWTVLPPHLVQSMTRELPRTDLQDKILESFFLKASRDFLRPALVMNGKNQVGPDTDPGRAITKLLDRGQLDQALRLAEKMNRTLPAARKTAGFNLAFLQVLRASGQLPEAKTLVRSVMKDGAVDSDFVLEAVGMARAQGDPPEEIRNLYYEGLMRLPDARILWGKVMEDRIWRGHPRQALAMLAQYRQKHPGEMDERMAGVYYAGKVLSGESAKADAWWRAEYKTRHRHRSLLARHAWLYRQAEKGNLRLVRKKALAWIRAGYESEALYRDLMVALGGLGEPIEEVQIGREALRKGITSSWIKNRVLRLESKGY